MFAHPFTWLMLATFIGAIAALLSGVAGMGAGHGSGNRSTRLMTLRVGLCFALLVEILIYLTYLKP